MKIPTKLSRLIIATLVLSASWASIAPITLSFAQEITTPPYILIGSKNYPPYEFLEYGEPKGLAIDLMAEIKRSSRLDISLQLVKWSNAQESVRAGKGIGHPFMASTPERKKIYDFSTPLVDVEFIIFVNKNATRAKSIADFAQKQVGVTKGSLPHQVIKYDHPDIKAIPFNNDLEAFGRLLKGEIDAVATGRLPGLYQLNKHGVDSIVPTSITLARKGLGISLLKGNSELLNELNITIERLHKSGRLDAIKQTWLTQYSSTTNSFYRNRTIQLVSGIIFTALVVFLFAYARRSKHKN